MTYELEDLDGREPVRLLAEHRQLVQWLTEHPRVGHLDYLNSRLADFENGLALYYIRGMMGAAKTFALVRGNDIVVFDAARDSRSAARSAAIGRVSVPETSTFSRHEIQALIASAFSAYVQAHGMPPFHRDLTADFERVRWEVRPARYSRLYFKRLIGEWARRQRPRSQRLRDGLKSPLAALLLLGLTGLWPVPEDWGWGQRLPMLLSAAWLIRSLLRYDSAYLIGPWFVGIRKLRNPMHVFGALGRVLEPKALSVLSAAVDPTRLADASVVRITITNHSLWLISHLIVPRSCLANLLSPQCLEAFKAGQLDQKTFDARMPQLRRRWLLPYRSASWSVNVEASETSTFASMTELEVLLCISRFASGEPGSGPNTYLIPVSVLHG